jgi:hypothetical protein
MDRRIGAEPDIRIAAIARHGDGAQIPLRRASPR